MSQCHSRKAKNKGHPVQVGGGKKPFHLMDPRWPLTRTPSSRPRASPRTSWSLYFFKGPRGRSISDPRADPLIMKGLLSGKTGLIKEWRDPSRPRDSFSVDLTVDDFRDGSEWLGHRFYLCGRFISLDESHVTYPSRLTSFFHALWAREEG